MLYEISDFGRFEITLGSDSLILGILDVGMALVVLLTPWNTRQLLWANPADRQVLSKTGSKCWCSSVQFSLSPGFNLNEFFGFK